MTIVVGVDDGPGGQLAARWAVEEALLRGSTLRVVHVSVAGEDPVAPVYARGAATVAPSLRGFLDALAYARDRLPDGRLSGIHPPGRPPRVLIEESAHGELLVVGSRDRPPLAAVLGSVGAAVAAHALPATVVVRAAEDEDAQRKRIVVGVDGSWHAAKALEFALAEARLRGTDLVVVHGHGAMAGSLDELIAVHTLREPAVAVEAVETDRDPAAVLIEQTRTAALTVVGSRGHSGVTGVVLGSISQAVLRHARGPVAVAR